MATKHIEELIGRPLQQYPERELAALIRELRMKRIPAPAPVRKTKAAKVPKDPADPNAPKRGRPRKQGATSAPTKMDKAIENALKLTGMTLEQLLEVVKGGA